MAKILDCPKEELFDEVNQFFMNTWDRHGSGNRPDAARNDLYLLRLSNVAQQEPENLQKDSNSSGKRNGISSGSETQVERSQGSCSPSSFQGSNPSENISKARTVAIASNTLSQRTYGNFNNPRSSDQNKRDLSSIQSAQNDKGQRSLKPDMLANDNKGRYLFARTRSSPELTDRYGDVSSQAKLYRAPDSGKSQIPSSRLDNSRRKNLESDNLANHDVRSSIGDPSSVRQSSSGQSLDASADSNNVIKNFNDDPFLGAIGEEFPCAVGTQGMQQEEQDLVNMMASSAAHGFNGPVQIPLNFASNHLPLPLPSSILASMGYSQRNLSGIVPNLPMVDTPSGANMQFPHGLVLSPLPHYFPGIGNSNPDGSVEAANENLSPVEVNSGETDHDYWHEQDHGSTGGFDIDNENVEVLHSENKQQPISSGYNLMPSSCIGGTASSRRAAHKFTREARESTREDHTESFHCQDQRVNEVHSDDRPTSSRSISASQTSSLRSKTNSESSWEGSSAKVSKSARDKRGRKTASTVAGKSRSGSEHSSVQTDDDSREWNTLPTMGTETVDKSTGPHSVASLHIPRHQMPGSDEAMTSDSDSMVPVAPILLGPGSRQRAVDNSGVVFYPTGPPVPFITMLPFNNYPAEAGTSDASTSHYGGDEGLGDSGQNFDLSDGPDQSDVLSTSDSVRKAATVRPFEHKSDILNSDFVSHWHNLQYGRFCQNPRLSSPLMYPSPVMVPPVYLQGRCPWDGPGRPLATNMNLFTQLVGYGPRLVPVTSLQSAASRPAGIYQRYMDEIPRYRGGTGTYLPNPVRYILYLSP